MGRRVETALDAGSATDRLEHRCCRTFAIRPGDLNRRKRAFRVIERAEKQLSIAETKLDSQSLMPKTQQIPNCRLKIH
jgi:hypothetical protein